MTSGCEKMGVSQSKRALKNHQNTQQLFGVEFGSKTNMDYDECLKSHLRACLSQCLTFSWRVMIAFRHLSFDILKVFFFCVLTFVMSFVYINLRRNCQF